MGLEKKKAFLVYFDNKEHIKLLDDEQCGKLFRALITYADSGVETELEGMTKMAFSFMKLQIDRDNLKYEEKCQKNQINGSKGGRPRKQPFPDSEQYSGDSERYSGESEQCAAQVQYSADSERHSAPVRYSTGSEQRSAVSEQCSADYERCAVSEQYSADSEQYSARVQNADRASSEQQDSLQIFLPEKTERFFEKPKKPNTDTATETDTDTDTATATDTDTDTDTAAIPAASAVPTRSAGGMDSALTHSSCEELRCGGRESAVCEDSYAEKQSGKSVCCDCSGDDNGLRRGADGSNSSAKTKAAAGGRRRNSHDSGNMTTCDMDNHGSSETAMPGRGDAKGSTSKASAGAAGCPVGKILEMYNSICKSFPAIKGITGKRRRNLGILWRAHPDISEFESVFRRAEASSFLKSKQWADFDWFINQDRFLRIAEGRYDDAPASLPAAASDERESSFDLDLWERETLHLG